MKQFTVRGLPVEIQQLIEKESKSKGISMNKALVEYLERSCAAPTVRAKGARRKIPDGLEKLFGVWNEAEARRFEIDLLAQRKVDEELWTHTD